MNRISTIDYKGIQIVFTDLSYLSADEAMRIAEMTSPYISKFPEKSVYSLANLTGLPPNIKMIEGIKEAAQHNSPYVITTAIYGLSGIRMMVANSVAAIAKREIKILSGKELCIQWLYRKSQEHAAQQNLDSLKTS